MIISSGEGVGVSSNSSDSDAPAAGEGEEEGKEEEEAYAAAAASGDDDDDSGSSSGAGSASVKDEATESVLRVVNFREETTEFITKTYPKLKEFECFLKLSFEAIKALHEAKGELKKPRFNKFDREEFIILCRWTEKYQDGDGKIKWKCFNEKSFSNLREQAPKHDLDDVLKKLGIHNKITKTLEAKSIESPAHFVQKPMSWYAKLCKEEQGSSKTFLLSGSDINAIQKFKEWYNHNSMGYLPSNWIASFRNDDLHPEERDLRRILREIGLNADAIEALKMNDIKDVTTLNRTSIDWRTGKDGDERSRYYEWKLMGLTRNDAHRIISFRHWHTFYIVGQSNTKNWTKEFNSTQYNYFLQRYQPGDNFSKPGRWKIWNRDSLRFPQEKHDYYDLIQKAAESGDVTSEQRYHLMQFYNKREKRQLIEGIELSHYEGHGDSTLEEDRLHELLQQDEEQDDEKEQADLLFDQQFCTFYFSAFLAFVLLWFWVGTTIFFMRQAKLERRSLENATLTMNTTSLENAMLTKNTTTAFDGERDSLVEGKGFEEHPGFDYVSFIHNVLFGLVTAVVVKELDDEAKETSLYDRFLPTYRDERRRQKERRITNRLNASSSCLDEAWELFKTALMWAILWSTRAYIIFWICFGAISLAFGAIYGIDTSNPLYVTGQAWLGVAVTISYNYFGLGGKIDDNSLSQGSTGAVHENTEGSDAAKDEGTTATAGKFNGKEKRMAIRTHRGLTEEILRYNALLTEAVHDKRFEDAAGHQRHLDQLDQLKETYPSLVELKSQLADVQDKMRAAAEEQDYVSAADFKKDVVRLQSRVKEEEDAATAGGG